MLTLSGYQILSQIYESVNSEVYRGIRVSDNQKVILKVLKQNYPTPSELTRYKQEYELTKSLNLEGIIKVYSLEKYQNTLVIILEDIGADSLNIWLDNSCLLLPLFLKIAIKIVDSLAQIHAENIIHKDINPGNIIFNPETEQLKLIDLGIATRLSKQNQTLKNPQILEGTLAYISPEQTGRMNRSLDYRTDFYSLGVTFYELLTGKLPFDTDDYLELVHCHLAQQPLSLSKINSLIPLVVSDIIIKLMAKNAEDRYQSAWGLKTDLEYCLNQLETTGKINYFNLATQDITDKFQIPQKLYGREREVSTLLATFARIANQSKIQNPKSKIEMILIAGYSGIGKSALVREIYKPITEAKGYFIAGKFDQFQRNIPYSALVNAFRELVKQLLTESETELQFWRQQILAALGINGQVIIDVIPEIELITGKQSPVVELGATESQNRFNLVFQKFIQSCCTPEHPLVMFLDDLQWADSATLKLIELIMNDQNLEYLLLIGAYRDNEVSQGHPLMMLLDNLAKTEVIIEQITLDNLSLPDIRQLIIDTLKSDSNQVQLLAELIYNKTGGNPFFTRQFLQSLYLENLINFNYTQHQWQWDINEISKQNITDNVIDLMINQLKRLPESTQLSLQLAACIGANFDLDTLSIIREISPQLIFVDLITAINSGFIVSESELDSNLLIQNYQFLHDRVQQAAYALIAEDQKAIIHWQIGQLLFQNSSDIEREQNLFDIVDHLNRGRELIIDSSIQESLAKLNLEAGIKAKNATAYAAAKVYLDTGIELLRVDCWQNQYQLTLNLYVVATEVAYLNGDFEVMDDLSKLVLEQAQTIWDKIKIYQIQIAFKTTQSKMLEAIAVGRDALQQLGIELPLQPDETQIKSVLENLEHQLQGKQIEELIDLPVMNDLRAIAIISLFWRLYPSIFQGMPALLPFQSSTMVSLSLQFGNTSASVAGYVIHGVVLCTFLGEVATGYRFGKLALQLMDNSPECQFKSFILQTFATCIQPRQEALRATLPVLKNSYQIGLETGDFLTTGYSFLIDNFMSFFAGVALETLQSEINSYQSILTQIKQNSAKIYIDLIQQAIANLREPREQPDCLIGTFYNETLMFPQHLNHAELTALAQAYTYKLLLAYIFGNYLSALDYISQAQASLMAVSSIIFCPVYHFYAALTYLSFASPQPLLERGEFDDFELPLTLLEQQGNTEQNQILAKVENHQQIVYQWAQTAPMNHGHQWHLIEAEKQRILGHKAEAIDHYDVAIKLAKENEYLQDEALANELVAKFYLNWGKAKLANLYLQEAYYSYRLWGASAKVKSLEQKYPQLLTFNPTTVLTTRKITPETSMGSNAAANLDLATVIKANQAIASEIVLENLLQTLMKILLENAGAQTGCLLLYTPNSATELGTIAIAINSHNNLTTLFPKQPIAETLPESVIYYVARTKENVIIDNATDDNKFVQDPYIQTQKPLSILCYPLLNQGNLIGIVYLENNLMTEAFTIHRIELLQLLSGQATISLTNAILYREREQYAQILEQKVSQRTAELQQANEELSRLANLDGLTQIANRRRFDYYLAREWKRHLREQQHLSLILIDIDYFKPYNDYYGHQGGDDCLIQVAQNLARIPKRPTDLVARYGGEEFAVILPNTHPEGALMIAEEMRSAIARLSIPHAQSQINTYITLSLGVASLIPTHDLSTMDLVARADQALYTAKNQGRDRTILLT